MNARIGDFYQKTTADPRITKGWLHVLGSTSTLIEALGVKDDVYKAGGATDFDGSSLYAVAWEMLLEAARTQNATVVMDKSLDNIYAWRELLQLYPNMLFLNVVRDPRVLPEFTGISSPFEEPRNPELIVDTSVRSLDECVEAIFAHIAVQLLVTRGQPVAI